MYTITYSVSVTTNKQYSLTAGRKLKAQDYLLAIRNSDGAHLILFTLFHIEAARLCPLSLPTWNGGNSPLSSFAFFPLGGVACSRVTNTFITHSARSTSKTSQTEIESHCPLVTTLENNADNLETHSRLISSKSTQKSLLSSELRSPTATHYPSPMSIHSVFSYCIFPERKERRGGKGENLCRVQTAVIDDRFRFCTTLSAAPHCRLLRRRRLRRRRSVCAWRPRGERLPLPAGCHPPPPIPPRCPALSLALS